MECQLNLKKMHLAHEEGYCLYAVNVYCDYGVNAIGSCIETAEMHCNKLRCNK